MWFLLGLAMGATLAGDGTSFQMQRMLSSIPLRCYAALDESDTEYWRCRYQSMRGEIARGAALYNGEGYSPCAKVYAHGQKDDDRTCDVNKAIEWEIKTLRTLAKVAEAHSKGANK